jgi:hypothetical protein
VLDGPTSHCGAAGNRTPGWREGDPIPPPRAGGDLPADAKLLNEYKEENEEKLPVIVLELRSGDVVALMGSVDPRSNTFILLQRDPGDPAAVVERFRECTGGMTFVPPDW